jgi:ComF family protein
MPASFLRSLGELLLPTACILCALPCGRRPVRGALVCAPCTDLLKDRRTRCRRCAIEAPQGLCSECRLRPPPFDRTLVLSDYRPPLDRAVHALKYGAELAIARSLGTLLAARLPDDAAPGNAPPVLTAVPLASGRLLERGFNQSLEIARAVGRVCSLPVDSRAVRRIRPGLAQAQLGPQARLANMAGAFEAEAGRVKGRAVWVVDDVITTGATLAAVAEALKRAGALSVTNLVLARTPIAHVQRRPGPP